MYRYAQCPACYSKLKYQGERSSLICPKCKTRIAIASELAPLAVHGLSNMSTQPTSPTAGAASNSQGLVIGIAGGTIVATLIVGALLLLPDSDVPRGAPPDDIHLLAVSSEPSPETARPESASEDHQTEDPETSNPSVADSAANPTEVEPAFSSDTADEHSSWHYRWKEGNEHNYSFLLDYEDESGKHRAKGNCTYLVDKVADEPTEEELTSTGTGFVVSPDGYLVTCAHVVHQAASIKVILDDQSWEGEVIAVDHLQDLALVKVKASGLPALPISTEADAVLAEPVRVVGYPLHTVLGKGVKITSGTVAGRADENESGGQSFQIDASVNPGNSGGPVVDDQGQVVGVASALLSGFQISEVGFAVPARIVRQFLEHAGITPIHAQQATSLSGPKLAELVVPAVAFLEVQLDPLYSRTHWVDFSFSYQTRSALGNNDSRDGPLESGFLPIKGSSRFAVNVFGEVSRYEGSDKLPFLLDPLGFIVLEKICHEERRQWTDSNYVDLNLPKLDSLRDFLKDHAEENEAETYSQPAVEEVEYAISKKSPELIRFTKKLECKTYGEFDPPLYQQAGSGTVEFDRQLGMPAKVQFESKVTFRIDSEGNTSTFPFTLKCELQAAGRQSDNRLLAMIGDAATLIGSSVAQDTEKYSRKLGQSKPQPRQQPRQQPKPQPVSPHERRLVLQRLDVLLAELDPKNQPSEPDLDFPRFPGIPRERFQHLRSLQRPSFSWQLRELSNLPVLPSKQVEVGKMLLYYAENGHPIDKSIATQGLVQWAAPQHVPEMIRLLTSPEEDFSGLNWPERRHLIEALGRFSTPSAYQAIASRLPYSPERSLAQQVLIRFGSDAEQAVVEVLDHKSEEVRGAAANILREIGTRKSLAALKKALNEESARFTKNRIQDAIDAIQRR